MYAFVYVCMYVCIVQWRHLNPALNAWSSRHNTRPHSRLPPNFLGTNAWITSQLKVAFICKLRGSLMCLAYFLNFLTCYQMVFVQLGTGRRPVDWCRDLMSVLYVCMYVCMYVCKYVCMFVGVTEFNVECILGAWYVHAVTSSEKVKPTIQSLVNRYAVLRYTTLFIR